MFAFSLKFKGETSRPCWEVRLGRAVVCVDPSFPLSFLSLPLSFLSLPVPCSLWNQVMKYGTWKLWWPREVGVTRWESPGSRICSSSSFLRLFSMPEVLVSGGVGHTPGKPAAGTPVGTGHGCHRPRMSQATDVTGHGCHRTRAGVPQPGEGQSPRRACEGGGAWPES